VNGTETVTEVVDVAVGADGHAAGAGTVRVEVAPKELNFAVSGELACTTCVTWAAVRPSALARAPSRLAALRLTWTKNIRPKSMRPSRMRRSRGTTIANSTAAAPLLECSRLEYMCFPP
jgi:hypothetical protein